jgi:hypothetical protein
VDKYNLYSASGTLIKTYGTVTKTELWFALAFTWTFIIADVSWPIIGANFLAHYQLIVDVHNKRLLDGITSLLSHNMVLLQ